jgi:hypothetical protein
MSATYEAALAYAARGWAVFPLGEGSKLPKIAKKDGGRGFHDATTDAAVVRSWWQRWPKANIGIRTGEVSGLLVVDIDGESGSGRWPIWRTPMGRCLRRWPPAPVAAGGTCSSPILG